MATAYSTIPAAPWDDLAGDWQNLDTEQQAPRYRILAGLIASRHARTVLDVGCGTAILSHYLPPGVRYQGIDPSRTAAFQAPAPVRCETAEAFDPQGQRWDIVVFNEMLYYVPDPTTLLQKYARFLTPRGAFLVSIYQRPDSPMDRIFRRHTNRHCTKTVRRFLQKSNWQVLASHLAQAGYRQPWWIAMVKPNR